MPIDIYWFEQAAVDVPAGNDWLGPGEITCLGGFRFAKRRADWRLGRWTSKCAVAMFLKRPLDPRSLAHIEIRPRPSGAPEVFLANETTPVAISLSHSTDTAMCVVTAPGPAIGCDLELVEPRSQAFIADYFTPKEQIALARASAADQAWFATALWSAKESALKALQEGLRFDTRSVAVSVTGAADRSAWSPLQVRCVDGQLFEGWWQQAGNLVYTLVSMPAPAPPMRLVKDSPAATRTSALLTTAAVE